MLKLCESGTLSSPNDTNISLWGEKMMLFQSTERAAADAFKSRALKMKWEENNNLASCNYEKKKNDNSNQLTMG